MKGVVYWVALTLLIIGGLNWGLVGLLDFNVVDELLGSWPTVVKVVYVLVGLSALYKLGMMLMMKKKRK